MTTKLMQYVHQSLAATGFCIVDHEVVALFRPDLYLDGVESSNDIAEAKRRHTLQNVFGTAMAYVKLEGYTRHMLILTRNASMLAERVEMITGLRVEEFAPCIDSGGAKAISPLAGEAQRREEARLAKLHELAHMEPPTHECTLRREILKARQELGIAA